MHRQPEIDKEHSPMRIITNIRRAATAAAGLLAAVLLSSALLAIPASPAVAKDCAYVCTADGDGGYTCQRICQ
jgi:hypothetical protein